VLVKVSGSQCKGLIENQATLAGVTTKMAVAGFNENPGHLFDLIWLFFWERR